MLTKIEAFNPRVLRKPIEADNGRSPFRIRDVKGLEPVTADVKTQAYGSIDGEAYMGSSVGKRNIVMTFGISPNWATDTVSSLRQVLYSYFMPKANVTLRFLTDYMPTVEIEGWVESCEPNIFAKDPQMVISIICPESEFLDLTPTVVTGLGGPFGVHKPVLIDYDGTVETGFLLKVGTTAATPAYWGDILMRMRNPETSTMLFNTQINDMKELQVSTVLGQKFSRIYIPGTTSYVNALGAMSSGSQWLQLDLGQNLFEVNTDLDNIAWELSYFKKYGGL